MYKEEYSECTSIRGRFQQYFVYGQSIDCSQWRRDLDNCEKWMNNKDTNAAVMKFIKYTQVFEINLLYKL